MKERPGRLWTETSSKRHLTRKAVYGSLHPLAGLERAQAKTIIAENHYMKGVPAGFSYYFEFDGAIIVYSIPANKNCAAFFLGNPGVVWELSRLWAPNGHKPNLLTQAIAKTAKALRLVVPDLDCIVSYADPNAGHHGGVYFAASWLPCGQSEETRNYYRAGTDVPIARRAFHSGKRSMTKGEIIAAGFVEERRPGKFRFARGVTKKARRTLKKMFNTAENASNDINA